MLSLESLKKLYQSSAPSSSQSISRLSARVTCVTCQGEGNRTSQKNFLLALNIDFTRDGAATDRGHV